MEKKSALKKLQLTCISVLAIVPVMSWARVEAAAPIPGVIGKVGTVSDDSIEIQSKDGVVKVAIEQPLTTYRQKPSDLSHVTPKSYVGIPSERQRQRLTTPQRSTAPIIRIGMAGHL